MQEDIGNLFSYKKNNRVYRLERQAFRTDVKHVHAVLTQSVSRLHSAHLLPAISAIWEQDKLYLLDEADQRHETGASSSNHPTYARTQACRGRLGALFDASDEGLPSFEEVCGEKDRFAEQLTELASETEKTFAKFTELAGHGFKGVLPITILGPSDGTIFCTVDRLALEDCLERTQLHRMLDQAMEGKIFLGEYLMAVDT